MQVQKSYQNDGLGKLYLVPTPIGNLEDMTLRAIRTLKEVDLIAAEDTRNTGQLLKHFEVETPQISFHEHNTSQRIPQLIERLLEGQDIAQVSDAGMPSISDPGQELVKACLENDISVIPLPGASAGITALVASGLSPQSFTFFGFLDRKNTIRRNQLESFQNKEESIILYESPHRLDKLLEEMVEVYGPDHRAVVVRELTKTFEEFNRGSLFELLTWAKSGTVKGEICLVLEGFPQTSLLEIEAQDEDADYKILVEKVIREEGVPAKEAIKLVAKAAGVRKQEVYQAYHDID